MNRRERKKEETRKTIIDCAISLFHEKGFAQATMGEIAEKADISKGTLYHYFSGKESILVGYFQSMVAKYAKQHQHQLAASSDVRTLLRLLLEHIHILLEQHRDLAGVYLQFRMQTFFDSDPFDNPNRSGLEHFLLEIMEAGQKSGELRLDIPALVLSRNFQFLIRNYLIAHFYRDEHAETMILQEQLIDLFLNGSANCRTGGDSQ